MAPAAATTPALQALPPHIAALQLLPLLATNFAQSVMITLPFSVGVFMVRSWAPNAGEDAVGRMAGLMAAAFSLSQATTCYVWGTWSSHYGRKPVMVIGSATSAAAVLWFGASPSYASACAARVAGGLLNGIIGAWKCIIGESCAPLGQGRAMSFMSLAWGVGCIVGPLAGGLLSQPCSTASSAGAAVAGAASGGLLANLAGPLCHEGSVLQTRPYLLPCLVVAALNVAACLLNVLLLQESLPGLRREPAGDDWLGSSTARSAWPRAWLARLPYQRLSMTAHEHGSSGSSAALDSRQVGGAAAAPCRTGGVLELGRIDSAAEFAGHAPRSKPAASPCCLAQTPRLPALEEAVAAEVKDADRGAASRVDSEWMLRHTSTAAAGGCCSISISSGGESVSGSGGSSSRSGAAPSRSNSISSGSGDGVAGVGGTDPWYFDGQVVLAVLGYGAICLLYIMLDEVTPMFASASVRQGGLGMSEAELAGPLVLGGLVLIVFSVAGFPRLQKLCGTLPVARAGLLLSAAVAAAIPVVSFLTEPATGAAAAAAPGQPGTSRVAASPLSLVVLASLMAIKSVAQCCAFTSSMVIVNTLPHPTQLGAVNGAGQTLASLTRGLGPLTGGLLWGLSSHVPGGQFLVFIVIAGVAMGAWVLFLKQASLV